MLVALIVGISAGGRFPGFLFPFAAAAVFSAAIMLWTAIEKKETVYAPLLLFVSLGYLSIQPWTAPFLPENHIARFDSQSKWKIEGVLANDPVETRADKTVFVVLVQNKGKGVPAVGRLRVTCTGDSLPELGPGDRVAFVGKIRNTRNFQNPGGFDYERFMAYQGILASSHTASKNLVILQKEKTSGFSQRVENLRKRISGKIDRTGIDNSSAAVLKALVVGDRSGIDDSLRDAFNRAGMGHLLAISGLHVGIVASFFFLFFSRLLSFSRTVLDKAWVYKGAALLCLAPVIFYGLIAGMSPSTQRAVLMVVVFLSAILIERENDPANTLAIAALLILIADPPALFGVSFQLSFGAVAAILFGFKSFSNLLRGEDGKTSTWKKLVAFFMTSIFAITGTLPLVMYYFNQFSLIGPAANFVLVPLVGYVAVPAGLISAFVLPFAEAPSAVGLKLAGNVLSFSIHILHFFADLPFAAVKTATPSFPEIVLYYVCGVFFLFWRGQKNSTVSDLETPGSTILAGENLLAANDRHQHSLPNIIDENSPGNVPSSSIFDPKKKRKYALFSVLALCAVGTTDISFWTWTRFFQDDLSITIVDVGQGNAAILEFPGGKTALIDGGGFYDNDIFDVGQRIVAPLLWRKKIMTVDTLFLTHPNSDHLNGLLYIAKNFNVKSVLTNNEPADTKAYKELLEIVERERIDMPPFSKVLGEYDFGGAKLEVLYPPPDFMERAKTESWRDENSNSLVIRVESGNFSCLFTGDITSGSEAELVAMHGEKLKSDILIAPHHGSKTSSSTAFLKAVDPDTIVISAGWRNRFRLPAPEIVTRYEKTGAKIYRTDLHGAVLIRSDGRSVEIEAWGDGG